MRTPDWLSQDPERWPPEARLAYSILARAALRRLAARQRGDGPIAAAPVGTGPGSPPDEGGG